MIGRNLIAGLLGAPALALMAGCETSSASNPSITEKRSAPNVYDGYSEAIYDGYERSSFYVPVRDGTRLAVDLFRPTLNGELADEELPVIWMHTPYNRRSYRGAPAAEAYPGYALELLPYGYNVALVDFRGVYASFGTNIAYNRGEWVDAAKWDAYDITEWFAAQPWSNGNIGMWGCSATGGSQMQALTTNPPSLKAVVPMSAELDVWPFAMSGGIPRDVAVTTPGTTASQSMIARRDSMAVPVDGPEAEALLEQAKAEHKNNIESVGLVYFRDSISEATGLEWWNVSSAHTYLDELKAGKTGVLSVANWDEAGTRHGPFLTYNNLPKDNTKLLVGPSTHCAWSAVEEQTGFDLVTEELRFYDYWLKGIENGVMDEPGVTYFTYNAPEDEAWRQSEVWPLENEVRTPYYLTPAQTLSTDEPSNDGAVQTELTDSPRAQTITVLETEDGLMFETAPLESPTEVTGHPVIHLWVEGNVPDADVTAFLHDLAPDGTATTYQMVGRLRASHRALADPPYDNLGLPWHPHTEASEAKLPANEPAELVFDMFPMSYIFPEGHKIRLQLVVGKVPGKDDSGSVSVLTGGDTASWIELPIIPKS